MADFRFTRNLSGHPKLKKICADIEEDIYRGFKDDKKAIADASMDVKLAAAYIKETAGAPVYIHEADVPMLSDGNKALSYFCPGKPFNPVEADCTLKDGDKIEQDGVIFSVMHTPGHTKGSVCYYVESERALFTGDTLFCLTVGRTDLYGGNDDEMYASIKRLYEMPGDYAIFTGHNRSTRMEYERRRNRYMRRFK